MTTIYGKIIALIFWGPHCQQANLKVSNYPLKHTASGRIRDEQNP